MLPVHARAVPPAVLAAWVLISACGRLPPGDAGIDGAVSRDEPQYCGGFEALGSGRSLGPDRLYHAAFSSDGRLLAVVVGSRYSQTTLRVLELPSLKFRGDTAVSWLSVGSWMAGLDWIGPDRLLFAASTNPDSSLINMYLFDVKSGHVTELSKNICGYRVLPNGSAVWVVHGCGGMLDGTLCLVDVAQPSCELPVSHVYAPSLTLSTDGRRLAFLTQHVQMGCGQNTGALQEIGPGTPLPGKTIAAELALPWLQYLPDGRLLWAKRSICGSYGHDQLLLTADGISTVLGNDLSFDGGSEGRYYEVSPQRDLALAGRGDPAAPPLQLHGLRLDGTGGVLLADDLFASPGFQAWAFTTEGRVLYVPMQTNSRMGLALLSRQGASWQKNLLSAALMWTWLFSPSRKELALVEAGRIPGSSQLKLVDLQTHLGVVLVASSATLRTIRFRPDGRALLFIEQQAKQHLLRSVGRDGGAPSTLGSWTRVIDIGYEGNLMGDPEYLVHPAGCAVVFDTDQPEPGGRIVALRR